MWRWQPRPQGNVAAQVAYSERSPRWRMPAAHFRHTESVPGGGTVELFFLDTDPIKRSYEAWSHRPLEPFAHDELAWLERELAASRARWKIVVGHHPVFSGGSHPDTPVLVNHVKPLLERYGVQLYLNGHSHALEHIAVGGVHYITSGAGAAAPGASDRRHALRRRERLGFAVARVAADTVAIEFVDEFGAVLYRADRTGSAALPVGAGEPRPRFERIARAVAAP
jgi:acid phosphatase